MSNRITLVEGATIKDKRANLLINPETKTVSSPEYSTSFETLAREGWDNLLDYIEWLGLGKDPDLVVLPSVHHYYYDIEDMKNIKTVVNLKGLNQIKQIESFFRSIFNILQLKSNFIGFYIDNEKINYYELENYSLLEYKNVLYDAIENGLVSRSPFINRLNGIMDSRTSRSLSKRYVSSLIEKSGFKIMDTTEINGLTYFHSRKTGTKVN